MKSIVRFFAREHLFGNLLTIMIVLGGVYSVKTIRRDIWPEVNFNVTTVRAVLGGASPEQVEKLIINPIEAALREVDGLKKIQSTAAESTGVVAIQLDPDARDSNRTNQDIQRAIDRIDEFPEDVDKPIVTQVESSAYPVIEVTVGGTATDFEIRDAADDISDELELLRLVSSVTKQGYRKKEFLVSASPEALAERQTSLSDLIQTISSRNVSIPGGTFNSPTSGEVLVRTEAQYADAETLKKTTILANAAGFGTRIGDVAEVTEELTEPDHLYRANGKNSINLVVAKKKNADALELVEIVKTRVKELKGSVMKNIDLGFSNDFTVYLRNRLNTLSSNMLIGLILVVLILSLFLPWQVTLVVAAGIPIALLGTLAAVFMLGLSLNMITLMGLIIVLGMLVDDAIVVSENIWRHIENGKKLGDAVTDGAIEVFLPVTASILTTVSAFAPLAFMTGIMGSFIFEMPLMVIMALGFSMFEAFIIMPSHFSSWVGPFIKTSEKGTSRKKKHWFDSFTRTYRKYVVWSLRKRWWMAALGLALLIGTAAFVKTYGRFVLFPPQGVEVFFVRTEAPIGTSLEKNSELIKPIENIIAQLPENELKDFTTSIGIAQQDMMDPQTRRGSHVSQIRVGLTPQHLRTRTAADIVEDFRQKIGIPEGIETVKYDMVRQGPPQGRPIAINILGEKYGVLNEITSKLKLEMKTLSGVQDIQDSYLRGKDEWQVVPDLGATAEVGLTAAEISQTVRASFEGIVASSVRTLDEEVDIRVKLNEKAQGILETLRSLKIGTRLGHLVGLGQVAEFRKVETIETIQHLNYKRVVNVSADVDLDITTALEATGKIRPIVDRILLDYPGYAVDYGGEDEDSKESMKSLLVAFSFAALFIFFLLITTFRNVFQPMLLMSTTIPFGFMGVVYALFIHGRPFSFMAVLGMIALAGVIVNNAIVFIDFVNKARIRGEDRNQSIINAATVRFRPIVLTTVTTVSGLLPTAYGETMRDLVGFGGGDPFVIPIALTLAWGLAFGSTLTGVFFPAILRVLDDIEGLLMRLWRRRPKAEMD